jgi:hypothetical protein
VFHKLQAKIQLSEKEATPMCPFVLGGCLIDSWVQRIDAENWTREFSIILINKYLSPSSAKPKYGQKNHAFNAAVSGN